LRGEERTVDDGERGAEAESGRQLGVLEKLSDCVDGQVRDREQLVLVEVEKFLLGFGEGRLENGMSEPIVNGGAMDADEERGGTYVAARGKGADRFGLTER
jgi:hypothetical protein